MAHMIEVTLTKKIVLTYEEFLVYLKTNGYGDVATRVYSSDFFLAEDARDVINSSLLDELTSLVDKQKEEINLIVHS